MKKVVSAAIEIVAEYIADLGCEAAKNKFDGKINELKLKKSISEFVISQNRYQETVTLCEEYDIQGLFEYLTSNFSELVSCRCYNPNSKLRGQAREELVSKACAFCNADSAEARKRVAAIVCNCLDMIRNYYKSEFSIKDYVLVSEIVEGVSETVGEKLQPIRDDIAEVKSDVKALNIYSPEAYANLAKVGNLTEIESRLDNTFYIMSKEHPLYPDYGYKMVGDKLLSRPLTAEAEKKYPPRYLCNGVLYLGDEVISQEEASRMDILDYADRHQLRLALEVHDVIKMLGERMDPQQVEAEALEGQMIVREPKEFPPAIACAILVNHEVMFEYLELRTREILDDGTYIIDNSEQQGTHVYISMRTKMIQRGNVDFTLNIDKASNKELYHYVRFMQAASKGADVDVKILSIGQMLCSGFVSTASYKCGFSSVDEELRFLKDICDVEEYVGHEVMIPDEITERQMQELSYLVGLIRGEEQEFHWKEFSMKGIIDQNFKQKIIEMDCDEHELSFVGNQDVPLFDTTINLPIVRRFNHAVVSNIEKIKKKLEVLDDGDDIGLSFECKDDNSGADYLNQSELKTDEAMAHCFAKKLSD